MNNKIEKFIWYKDAVPILEIPIILPLELNIKMKVPSIPIEMEHHIYKLTGKRNFLTNEYEYEYQGSTKL